MRGIIRYVRGGMGDAPANVNPTTIWLPGTGPGTGFVAPGYGTPAPAVYQAPNYVAAPACLQANGGAFVSQDCVNEGLKVQQQNMAAANAANYNVDLTNCENNYKTNAQRYTELGMPVPPDTCAQETFGLVPVGGYTGSNLNLVPDAVQLITGSDPNAPPAPCTPPSFMENGICTSPPQVTPAPAAPATTIKAPVPPLTMNAAPASTDQTGTNYVSAAQGFLEQSVPVAGSSFPLWGIAAAGLAAGLALILLMKGGR